MTQTSFPVLEHLRRRLAGSLEPGETTSMRYPTAIARLLGLEIVAVAERGATIRIEADVELHGNQQGTVHGGLLCELADAAIGTAHSTIIQPGESFTSLDLDARFVRPAWSGVLVASARCTHPGRTISHYQCEIRRDDGTSIASVTSAVMTLRGAQAAGR
ncbi:PaaI family thioesterase [Curtobacterium sp. 22159]|uniref:PaaI family thioesterase n=1 Tax=Curtobacterium sp. 22159 TaxID=3453882 RepID=UPI003F836BBB